MRRTGLDILILALIACVGLETGCGTPAKQSQALAATSLIGTWSGTFTGTNVSATGPFMLTICDPTVGGDPCGGGGPSVYVKSASVGDFNCDGWGTPSGSTGAITVAGQQFTASGSGSINSNTPWTLSLNGTVATGNQSMSGTISFSLPGCGTAANPWTGTFTAALQP